LGRKSRVRVARPKKSVLVLEGVKGNEFVRIYWRRVKRGVSLLMYEGRNGKVTERKRAFFSDGGVAHVYLEMLKERGRKLGWKIIEHRRRK